MVSLKFTKHRAGFVLGADACAEHEIGLAGLRRLLNVGQVPPPSQNDLWTPPNTLHGVKLPESLKKPEPVGLARRLAKAQPEHITLITTDTDTTLVVGHNPERLAAWWGPRLQPMTEKSDDMGFQTAWSSDFFVIVSNQKPLRRLLSELHAALLDGTAVFGLGSIQGFMTTGPSLALRAHLPHHLNAMLVEQDVKFLTLSRLDQAIDLQLNLRERFKTAGCGFFALSPRWPSEIPLSPVEHPSASAWPLRYWLNPKDQERVPYGVVSVEDLENWMQGHGRLTHNRA